jgi:hypothetical protein
MPITNTNYKAGFNFAPSLDNWVPITNQNSHGRKNNNRIQFDPPSKSPPNPIKEFINMMNSEVPTACFIGTTKTIKQNN